MLAFPESITSIEITKSGASDVLAPVGTSLPRPRMGEVLIKVEAAGVNRADLMQVKGHYPPPRGASEIPGLEIAGVVVEAALGVHDVHVGDRVCALLTGGGYAEYATAPAVQCLPIPQGFSAIEAAGLPEAAFTAWSTLVERGGLKRGDTVLIHGGTSGVGVFAIQLAKAMGARVFATAGSFDKTHLCEALGAERGINYKLEDYVKIIGEATGNRGADIILDMVGGDYVQRNFSAAAVGGRIVNIAFSSGAYVNLDLTPILKKRLVLTAASLRDRPVSEKGAIAAALKERVWPLIEKGLIKPVVDKTFPLTKAADAHRLMASSTHKGKIILTMDSPTDITAAQDQTA